MNKDIHPALAALIAALFMVPIFGKFYLSGQEAEHLVGNFYISDGRDGTFYLQINEHLLQVAWPSEVASEVDVGPTEISTRSQIAFFKSGEALARLGDWDTDLSTYLGLAEVVPQEDEANQAKLDKYVGDRAAKNSDIGAVIARCDLPTLNCGEFHRERLRYSHNYNAAIHPENDSVFITEGMAHKISHYTAGGERIAEYGVDLRFPKRLEFHEDSSFYFANTNRNRIERLAARDESVGDSHYETFSQALPFIEVGGEFTGDSEYIWPLAVKYFADQWWVINMGPGMRRGRLFHFSEEGEFLGRWPLPEDAEPMDLLVFDGQLLVTDGYHGSVHRIGNAGTALPSVELDKVHAIVGPLTAARQELAVINQGLTSLIVLGVLVLLVLMLRGIFSSRGKAQEPATGRPTFSMLNSKESRMLISSIEVIPSMRVIKHLGLVQGSTVRAKHAGKDIMAGFKNLFGGELDSYTELLQESREEAVARMTEQAKAIGANAVINVRFSTSAIAAGASEILAYGTAVQIQEA